MSGLTEYRNLIAGELRPAASGKLLESINPATGEVWARIPASGPEDVDAAARAAAAAWPMWSSFPPSTRRHFLKLVANVFLEHGEELALLETQDNGTLIGENRMITGMGMAFLWERAAEATLSAVTGRTAILDATSFGLTRREPYGVVAAIVPWNAPLSIACNKAACALAAGNTVVVKPPEQASVATLRAAELIAGVLPPGVFNVVSGLGAEVGEPLVRHPAVRKVTMTGSTATARKIQRAGADTLTPAVFELGGKSPNIVFADADLDRAAVGVTSLGIYTSNCGQGCVAGSRILVQRSIVDEMIARIRAMTEKVVLGDPMDPTTTMGPIISQAQHDKVAAYIDEGKAQAELVFGGRHGADLVPHRPGGYWVEPTLFTTTDNSLRICQEEIFGPVAVLIPFDTDDEAVAIANDSPYGLAAGVWTRDLARAQRFVRDIHAGNVWVNTYLECRYELPFVGYKDSGYGLDDVLEYTREKSAVITTA